MFCEPHRPVNTTILKKQSRTRFKLFGDLLNRIVCAQLPQRLNYSTQPVAERLLPYERKSICPRHRHAEQALPTGHCNNAMEACASIPTFLASFVSKSCTRWAVRVKSVVKQQDYQHRGPCFTNSDCSAGRIRKISFVFVQWYNRPAKERPRFRDARRMTFTPNTEISIGDWVKTPAGEQGQIAGINGRTAHVKCGKGDRLDSFLLRRLTKINPPTNLPDEKLPPPKASQ